MTSHQLLAYTAFLIGVASPGPSVLAVMGAAMTQGRTRALALAGGIVCGSLFWGLCAAFGLAALMERYAAALVLLKIVGGVYLLWLAWQAGHKALAGTRLAAPVALGALPAHGRLFVRGLAMHLTNPKSIVVWLSVTALALPSGADKAAALSFVATCVPISATVFTGYALAFSTTTARRLYRAGERAIHALLAGVFAYAGLRLLGT